MTRFHELAQNYTILIAGGPPSNYSAWSPDLPGCVATGSTVDECEREMLDAIAFHLEGMSAHGEVIPQGTGPGVYIAWQPQTAA